MSMAGRYGEIAAEARRICIESGRDPDAVCVVAVSKTVGVETVAQAIAEGITAFGENRPDMLQEKQARFPEATWHFIGNIQSRRISDIVASADLIHSVFQARHLERIGQAASDLDKVQEILVEVNVSGEESKGGVVPDGLEPLIETALGLKSVRVAGLMTMAPQGDPAHAQACFEKLADLRDKMRDRFAERGIPLDLHELSMGMSEDWREGVRAGATIVRIGRAIFSDDYSPL